VETIHNRRSVRVNTDASQYKITTGDALVKTATHAPSSMKEQPWAFAVIQNPTKLASWSDHIKAYVPVFPVVVGYPSGKTPPVQRRAPEILVWQ